MPIDAYSINACWWLFYWWLLVVIILIIIDIILSMAIDGYSINGY
jgi:hypothetical protein